MDWCEKAVHLNNLMQKMRNTGYDPKFRLEALKSSINGYEKIVEDDNAGTKPLYKQEQRMERNE